MKIAILSHLLCQQIKCIYTHNPIFTFNVNYVSPNIDLDNFRDYSELWNVELHTINIYTYNISKVSVNFIVCAKGDRGLDVYIYLEKVEELCINSKMFYFIAYSKKYPKRAYRTKTYQIEMLITKELKFYIISHETVRFVLNMIYLYQGIVEIKDISFPKSKFLNLVEDFNNSKRFLLSKFMFDLPLFEFYSKKELIRFIKNVIWYYAEVCVDESRISRKLIEDLCFQNELMVNSLRDDDLVNYLIAINDWLELEMKDCSPVNLKLLEIFDRKHYDIEKPNNTCSFI